VVYFKVAAHPAPGDFIVGFNVLIGSPVLAAH
jgi:hypothetical protein